MKIEEIKYKSFLEFAKDVLFPGGNLYKRLNNFVYRGERTRAYKLLPGALREDNLDKLFCHKKPIDNQAQWLTWQVYAEYSLIREFYKVANNGGLKVPRVDAISQNYNDLFPTELHHRTGVYKWISDDVADLAALAQHYGVLTRLLDWSYDLYVALYFACVGAIKAYEEEGFKDDDTIVIWALNANYIQFLQPTTSRIPLKFVVPPYHDNPNLNAQKGVLSYWEVDVPSHMEQAKELQKGIVRLTDRSPLDVLLQAYCDAYPGKNEDLVLLYKLEIPVQESIAVYNYLNNLGYTASKLFPGYDGVVKDMEEKAIFQRVIEQLLVSGDLTNKL